MAKSNNIVVNGKAWVELYAQAILFWTLQIIKNGPKNFKILF